MIVIEENKQLKPFNTFGIKATANYFVLVQNEVELIEALSHEYAKNNKILVLGGGSNFLFCNNFQGIAIKPEILGIEILEENPDYAIVKAGAGIEWDKLVEWSVNHNLSGLENLSHIPGTVGACPVQNIGAYGVEVKDTIYLVEGIDISTKQKLSFSNENCTFGYRTSIFKTSLKNKIVITNVSFKLSKKPTFCIDYGSISNEIEKLGGPNLKNIRQAIINIRTAKLPDPSIIGNAGSFFKNPIVKTSTANELKSQYNTMPLYDVSEGFKKIAAAFLIEQCGWKGYKKGDAGVHINQPLVLVNYGNASGKDMLDLAQVILKSIYERFGIELEMEVNVI